MFCICEFTPPAVFSPSMRKFPSSWYPNSWMPLFFFPPCFQSEIPPGTLLACVRCWFFPNHLRPDPPGTPLPRKFLNFSPRCFTQTSWFSYLKMPCLTPSSFPVFFNLSLPSTLPAAECRPPFPALTPFGRSRFKPHNPRSTISPSSPFKIITDWDLRPPSAVKITAGFRPHCRRCPQIGYFPYGLLFSLYVLSPNCSLKRPHTFQFSSSHNASPPLQTDPVPSPVNSHNFFGDWESVLPSQPLQGVRAVWVYASLRVRSCMVSISKVSFLCKIALSAPLSVRDFSLA